MKAAARAEGGRERKDVQPTLSVFTQINSYTLAPGMSDVFRQMFRYAYPEYAVGFSLTFAASQEAANAEQVKWDLGYSTLDIVYQKELDLTSARAAEIQSRVNYAKAVIAQELAVGYLLESHGIAFDEALKGSLWKSQR